MTQNRHEFRDIMQKVFSLYEHTAYLDDWDTSINSKFLFNQSYTWTLRDVSCQPEFTIQYVLSSAWENMTIRL